MTDQLLELEYMLMKERRPTLFWSYAKIIIVV